MAKEPPKRPTRVTAGAAVKSAIHVEKLGGERLPTPLRILNHGPAGSGKTYSLNSLPELPHRVVIFDFDRMAHILNSPYDMYRFGKGLGDAITYEAACMALNDLHASAKEDPISVAILDTVTTLGIAAMNKILADQGRIGQNPDMHDYAVQMFRIEHFVFEFTALPVTHAIIVNAHSEYEKDEATGAFIQRLAVTGKLSTRMFRFFSDIIYSTRIGEGEEAKYQWLTKQNRSTVARTQVKLDEKVVQDYDFLLKAAKLVPHEEEDQPNE